jgi:host factor-I protein
MIYLLSVSATDCFADVLLRSSSSRCKRLSLTPPCLVYNASMPLRAQGSPNAAKRGRTPPPEETFEEASFLKALGEKQKQVSVKLMDGQTVSGWIEYYDKYMIRLTREGVPNLFIFKHEIMYIAEDGAKR